MMSEAKFGPTHNGNNINLVTVTGICSGAGCGISVSFPNCPVGVCPAAPVNLVSTGATTSEGDLILSTNIVFSGVAGGVTGPTAGLYNGNAIRMTATSGVAVVATSSQEVSGDSSVVFPIEALGTDYIVGAPQSGPQSIILPPYASFLMLATSSLTTADLTGLALSGTQPFAAIVGNQCGNVPDTTVPACDLMFEQLPATVVWGTRFPSPTVPQRAETWYKLVPSEAGTMISLDGGPAPQGCSAAASYGPTAPCYFSLQGGTFHVIDTSAPALLLMLSPGGNFNSDESDPFLSQVPHIGEFQSTYMFVVPTAYGDSGPLTAYVSIAFLGSAADRIMLIDGTPGSSISWTWDELVIGPDTFQFATGSAGPGTYLMTQDSGIRFSLQVSMHGRRIGFGFTPGLVLPPRFNVPPAIPDPVTVSPGCMVAMTDGLGAAVTAIVATATDAFGNLYSVTIVWGDGATDTVTFGAPTGLQTGITATHRYTSAATYTITAFATDTLGASSVPVPATCSVTVTNAAPTISGPVSLSLGCDTILPSEGTITASVDASDINGNLISVVFNWGDGTLPTIVSFTATGSKAGISATHTYSGAGIYVVTATAEDELGATSPPVLSCLLYVSDASSVTGGGWIQSPAGALVAQSSPTGKASIDVSLPGSPAAAGNVGFVFNVPAAGSTTHNLIFKATAIQRLFTVAGWRAIVWGVGTINSVGSYAFQASITDGAIRPGGKGAQPDRFRIRITEPSSNNVVYDNGLAVARRACPLHPWGAATLTPAESRQLECKGL
ncbi:hypothetical protein HYH02_005335 [Chlamydomonas schloesseri]|uniref:PKD domain-containing protein n=1 Tax=Chlamydomonas schloesseri TaxID=2026947 RepID=A0A836B7B3_9CHLO|nr:hypothetical protein HYH02_005335 [Chlamydomonas schloesseri]|eukprot:KAG2449812.1 hypothetical protein HYH02_005335 [Chlamydomonas schloesseri]